MVGVGWANPDSTAPWVENEGFQYEIWTDQDKELSLYYDAASQSSFVPDRVTRILDSDGTLVLEYNDIGFAITAHPNDVLEDCKLLFGE